MEYLILSSSLREIKMERERDKNAYPWLSSSVVWLGGSLAYTPSAHKSRLSGDWSNEVRGIICSIESRVYL